MKRLSLMSLPRSIRWAAIYLAILIAVIFCYYHFFLDWQGRPFCHKQIMISFELWMGGQFDKDAFPNVGGIGRDSLAVIHEEVGNMKLVKDYRYVPGLRKGDPDHLVLLYIDRPTRWTWHGPAPTIFTEKAWIIVPVDFTLNHTPVGGGEMSERVDTDEFKKRLRETIEFIRTNGRPNWQTIVAEHTKFLESLEHHKN